MQDQFEYDVFLSHNKADKPCVRELACRLRDSGIRVWFDEWVIQPGDDIYLAIEHGLESSQILVLCLSAAALGADWVAMERSTVLFRNPTNQMRRFLPILLAECRLPDALARYKYLDYTGADETTFQALLAAIRNRTPAPPAPSTTAQPFVTPPEVKSHPATQRDTPIPQTQGGPGMSSPPAREAGSTMIKHPFEKSLVCIWVDGIIAGTGCVIASDRVLTCAHVVSHESGEPQGQIQVEAYHSVCEWVQAQQRSVPEAVAPFTLDALYRPVEAEIDGNYWRSEKAEDIAVLKLKAPLADGTSVLSFSHRPLQGGEEFRTRGFASVGDTHGVYAEGKVAAHSVTRSGQASYQLECGNITRGFSGAPLCDHRTGEVLGLINAIARQDSHGKLTGVAFAIPNETLVRVVDWLRREEDELAREQRRQKLAKSHTLLEKSIAESLNQCRPVWQDLVGTRLARPDLCDQLRITELVDTLRQEDPEEIVQHFEDLAATYRNRRDDVALNALTGLFAAVAPTVMDSRLVDQILAKIGIPRNQPLEIPWDSVIMFEYVMARLDGRPAAFRPPATESGKPKPGMLLDPLPEQGFAHPVDKDNLEVLIPEIAAKLGRLPAPFKRKVNLEAQTIEGRARELNKSLKIMHQKCQTPFLEAKTDAERQLNEDDLRLIHRVLTYLAVVEIKPCPNISDADEKIQTLTRPINDHTLLPPDTPVP